MPSLTEKLKSMGVHLGTQEPAAPKKNNNIPIEKVVPGHYETTEFGDIFISENHFSLDHYHGNVKLNPDYDPIRIFEWAKIFDPSRQTFQNAIFIDTETTGLAGGTGTFAFMTGLGYFTEGGFHLAQLFMRDPSEEKAMLAYLEKILAGFSIIISFNGKSFDIPILKTRFELNQLPNPFASYSHIDVLHLARKIWRLRLPNRSLKELETQILKLKRTEEEIPGWLVPQLYVDYLHSQDASPLKGVFYHNGMDVVSLAALYKHLAEFIEDPLSFEFSESLDLVALANLYEDFDHIDDAVSLYDASLNAGIPEEFIASTLSRFGHLFRQRKDWNRAIQVWEKAVEHGHLTSAIDLAKAFEHQLFDFETAKLWTGKCIEMVELSFLRKFEKRELNKQLEKRLKRLNQKINDSKQTSR
jgi:uncharacterized protein YprB with RNaseH-like and TPR domain